MTHASNREIRRIKYRNEPYYIYYSPGTSFRAHDHNYVLRLLSDKLAWQNPKEFCLLPQFRSMGMAYPHGLVSYARNHHGTEQSIDKVQSKTVDTTKPVSRQSELNRNRYISL